VYNRTTHRPKALSVPHLPALLLQVRPSNDSYPHTHWRNHEVASPVAEVLPAWTRGRDTKSA